MLLQQPSQSMHSHASFLQLPGIPNSTTTADVVTAAASAAGDTDVICCNNQDKEGFKDDKDYEESVEANRGHLKTGQQEFQ